jgi:pyruvate dehydrogenase E2 component (dihydrolipoyllysine-residue acetyltransferase)
MGEFSMPSLGADMTEGTLVEWLVKKGDRVRRGDIIASVETQKGLFEVESFESGIVQNLLVAPGTTVPVGTALAMLAVEGTSPPAPEAAADAIAEQYAPTAATSAVKPASAAPHLPPASPPGRLPISPSARKLAAELKIDPGGIRGTGPHGAIQRADVERAAMEQHVAGEAPVPQSTEKPPAVDYQTGMRQAIAAAMSRSNRDIPHYYLETDIDMSRTLRWLEGENLKRSIRDRILPAVLLLKGVAKALADVPDLNGFWLDGRHQVREAIHIGFAISLRQGGLIAPAIHNVDLMGLDDLMAAVRDLIDRTRTGRLRSSEMTDATITVTNLGDRGVNRVYGVIYPPQVALVGFGRISERPWAENGMLGVRRIVTATLSADHRATDGHRGSLFLEALGRHLQTPEEL